MESNDANEVMISGSDEVNCPETTVEIKIKTLDSQTYTLRVNKYVPIPALKAQIATVTGVLSEQQRLICRGKVLKDDQLLSAYHVEDGHTLHLVARQPIPPSLESHPDFPATDQASNPSNQNNQAGPSVVVGTFNISEQGDGVLPDLSRIVSAVLGSFGIPNIGSANEGTDLREAAAERLSRTNVGDLRNSSGQQTDQAASRSQSIPDSIASLFPASVPLESLQLPAIPDSLTTLSQYSTRLRNEFTAHAGAGNSFQAARILRSLEMSGQESDAGMRTTSGPAGLPTPSSLAEVMLSTRQIFTDQAAECLTQFTRLLEDQTNVTDPLARMNIQSNAIRSGVILQNLGAFLLELGRTTMTLRMGATPVDAVVNAGPAVFISTAGPNPIMVQPLPFQPGTSFGAIPVETIQANSGWAGGSLGSGLLPRNIDIRIRTGPSMPSTTTSQRDPAGVQQSPARSNPSGGNSIHQPAPEASGTPSSTRGPEVRVIPVRTVVAAVPASARRAPSDSSRGSMGLFYPVLARVQHVASGRFNNVRGPQTSEEAGSGGSDPEQQPAPDSALPQQDSWLPGADVNTPSGDGNQNVLDQMLRSMFPGGQIHVGEANVQGMGSTSVAGHVGTAQGTSSTQEAVSRVDDGGLGLSNLLRQIMPFISENTDSGSASLSRASDVMDGTTETSTTQGRENPDRGSLSRRNGDPPSSPSSKRQRRE